MLGFSVIKKKDQIKKKIDVNCKMYPFCKKIYLHT